MAAKRRRRVAEQPQSMPTYLESHSESPAKPPGPMKGLWSIRYLDLHKSARLMISRGRRDAYKNFSAVLEPGTPFPTMDLETTEGTRFNTDDLHGKKHLVVMAGAIT